MSTNDFQKFCPVCKLPNDQNATICQHCKTPFKNSNTESPPTTKRVEDSFDLTEEIISQITRAYPPPSVGILFFLLNNSKPIALCTEQEFVLGRGGALVSKLLFDLSEFDAYAMGVSRTHAVIRVVDNEYVLIDLNSANGTWLNGDRLVPGKSYDLPSGAVIQLGRLKLVAVYSHPPG